MQHDVGWELTTERFIPAWFFESVSGHHKVVAHLSEQHPGGAVHNRGTDLSRASEEDVPVSQTLLLVPLSLCFADVLDSASSRRMDVLTDGAV